MPNEPSLAISVSEGACRKPLERFRNVHPSHRFLSVRTRTNRIRIIAATAKSSLPLSMMTFYAGDAPSPENESDVRTVSSPSSAEHDLHLHRILVQAS
jgi:hypothetical protein